MVIVWGKMGRKGDLGFLKKKSIVDYLELIIVN